MTNLYQSYEELEIFMISWRILKN